MSEQKFVYVDVDYLKELEETAKKVDYYKGIIDAINMVADRKTEPQTCSVNGRPYDCGNCEYHRCTADEPQTHCPISIVFSCEECKYAWWNSDAKRYECSVGRCQYTGEPQTEREDE